jgi:uncharacterized protein YkuJ
LPDSDTTGKFRAMERIPNTPVSEETLLCRGYPVFLALLIVLVGWQGWMTLSLFGPEEPWSRLVADKPILDGSHPANLYLSTLGAQAWAATGRCCCYDANFQVGFPRTPIINGSRVGQIFMLAAGAHYEPAAYKIGLAVVSMLVPFFFMVAARGVGLSPLTSLLATALGLLLWWGGPSQEALKAVDFELLLAALAILSHVGLLIHFHRAPGFLCWLGMLDSGWLAWFAQPLLLPILLPLLLIYYLTVGAKHASLIWHLALLVSELGALALNLFWLSDWVEFWWLRLAPQATSLLRHRTLQTLWNAPIWGTPADRTLAMVLLIGCVAGVLIWHYRKQRLTARLLGMGAGGLLILALLGIAWEPLGQMGSSALLVPALWFATLPAAYACTEGYRLLHQLIGPRQALVATVGLAGVLLIVGQHASLPIAQRCFGADSFTMGLGPEQQETVDKLKEHTTPESRILWENRSISRTEPHWSALLPLLTGRSFVGGLDSEPAFVHASIGIVNQALNEKPISTWSGVALEDYCRQYNIGWVACWSPAVVKHFQQWSDAVPVTTLNDHGTGMLFRIKGHIPTYALKGQARLVQADSRHITLADVVPENGEVVLSLHYQAGMRALPSRVKIERERYPFDPVDFIRLKVASPAARVTLMWDEQ